MKHLITPFLYLVIILASSCKKDSTTDTDETRLIEAQITDSLGAVTTVKFTYDGQGRINSCAYVRQGHTDKSAAISYSDNTITILYKPQNEFWGSFNSTVRYTLDNEQKPVQRIQYDSLRGTDEYGQITIGTDTSMYEYEANGLLKRITGIQYDTIRFNPNSPNKDHFYSQKDLYSYTYTNSGNLLTQLAISTNVRLAQKDQYIDIVLNHSAGEKYSFEYHHQYQNNIDFSNALLLSEFEVVYPKRFPFSKTYVYLPDKINFVEVTGNRFWFESFSYFPQKPLGSTESWTLEYKNDFIVSLISSSKKTVFKYNKAL